MSLTDDATHDVFPPLSDLLQVEEYSEFFSAANRAKKLANTYGESTGLRRTETGWVVLASLVVVHDIVSHENYRNEAWEDQEWAREQQRHLEREFVQPIWDEIQGDQDSWSRSEEGGWFYEE